MKAFTDISQSKKLAKILPLESADMYFTGLKDIYNPKEYEYEVFPKVRGKWIVFDDRKAFHPCWSLAALLELLPYEINDKEGTIRFFELYSGYREQYHIIYTGADEDIEGEYYDNFVDACVEMIEKLYELKML